MTENDDFNIVDLCVFIPLFFIVLFVKLKTSSS